MASDQYKYHAFISHAVEDKLAIANELCRRLEQAGLNVWYSGKELKAGDSLERAILTGLDQSKYGIVILSPAYVEKNWPWKEYYLLIAKEREKRKVILPVLYNITPEELVTYDSNLADRWSINYERGMDHVVQKLLEEILGSFQSDLPTSQTPWRKLAWVIAIVSLLCLYFLFLKFSDIGPPEQVIEDAIAERVLNLDLEINKEHTLLLSALNATPATIEDVKKILTNYANLKTNYRNAYEFRNGLTIIQSRKNVEAALKINLDPLTPVYLSNLPSPNVFLATREKSGKITEAQYILVNTQPVTHFVNYKKKLANGNYEVSVSYDNNLRHFVVELFFPGEGNPVKKHFMTLKGYLPVEKYVFEKEPREWVLKDIQ